MVSPKYHWLSPKSQSNCVSLLVLSFLLISAVCDCPLARYRPQIRTGQVRLTQSQLTQDQPAQTTHIHPLDTPLFKPNPTVLIGLTGYSYTRLATNVEFQIANTPTADVSALSFSIRSLGALQNQRTFAFRFLAIDQDFILIQAGTHKGHPTLSPIPDNFALNSPSLSLNTQVAIFLHGFKAINLLDTCNLQLSSPKINSGQLKYTFTSNLLSNQIDFISFSYLLYNKLEYSGQNEVSLQTLAFTSESSMRVRFNSLQFTESTFFGLSMISFGPNFVHSIDITLDGKSSADVGMIIDSNLNDLRFELFIWQSFVKQPFVCSFCKDSPFLYEERFCVSKCPRDSVPQQGQLLKECKKCSIEEIRVLDPVNQRCVCAVSHFDNFGTCTPCHFTCLTCVGESELDCLTCDVALRKKLTFRELVKPNSNSVAGRCGCPVNGFYAQDLNIRCIACHADCKTCSGSEDTDCMECRRQRTKNELGMCVCKSGYSSQADGSCACLNSRFEASGSCINPLNSCGQNEIQVVQNIKTNNGKSINANNGNNNGKGNNKNTPAIPIVTTTTSKTCQCKQGFARVKGECLRCGPNEQYNQKKGICQCVKEAVKQKTKGCIVCGADKRYDRETESCVCRNKNQFQDKAGNCISCPKKSIFYQDKCYCINNYFMNSKGKCQKCNRKSENPQCKRYPTTNANDQ